LNFKQIATLTKINKNVNFSLKGKFGLNLERDKIVSFKKIETKLNKNNEYRDQIEYKTLTLTCDTLLS